jgi:hypothetical protein
MKNPVLYKYIGPHAELSNMFFNRLAEFCSNSKSRPTKEKWPSESEAWKYDLGEENIFMISIMENYLQPPHIQKIMSKVTETADDVEVSEEGIAGLIWNGSQQDFEKDFKKVGK